MPGARFSKMEAITATPDCRAACDIFSVVGPGIGSARSKREASSRWQKYCVRKSSGRQTTWAPRLDAACTCSTARARFSSGSGPQRSCTNPTRKFWTLEVGIGFDSIVTVHYEYSVLRTQYSENNQHSAISQTITTVWRCWQVANRKQLQPGEKMALKGILVSYDAGNGKRVLNELAIGPSAFDLILKIAENPRDPRNLR